MPSWLNVVGNKKEYLNRLTLAVEHLHEARATWRETVPVHEVFRGAPVWRGHVEVFDLDGHKKAKRAYAWSHLEGKMTKEKDSLRF